MKTREDFFLDEEWEAYQAEQRLFDWFNACKMFTDSERAEIKKLVDALSYSKWKSGYAEAEFDFAERDT